MTPQEFAKQMAEIWLNKDTEIAHLEADRLMCKQLRDLNYNKGVDIFEEAYKWYA